MVNFFARKNASIFLFVPINFLIVNVSQRMVYLGEMGDKNRQFVIILYLKQENKKLTRKNIIFLSIKKLEGFEPLTNAWVFKKWIFLALKKFC